VIPIATISNAGKGPIPWSRLSIRLWRGRHRVWLLCHHLDVICRFFRAIQSSGIRWHARYQTCAHFGIAELAGRPISTVYDRSGTRPHRSFHRSCRRPQVILLYLILSWTEGHDPGFFPKRTFGTRRPGGPEIGLTINRLWPKRRRHQKKSPQRNFKRSVLVRLAWRPLKIGLRHRCHRPAVDAGWHSRASG
jgi:hypothetical protein